MAWIHINAKDRNTNGMLKDQSIANNANVSQKKPNRNKSNNQIRSEEIDVKEVNLAPNQHINYMTLKTPVAVLQQLLTLQGIKPSYELVQIEGAVHEPLFHYRVSYDDKDAMGAGKSKKEAKHSAAKNLIEKMNGAPFNDSNTPNSNNGNLDANNSSLGNPIGWLQELCMAHRWPLPTYETELGVVLPHKRQFTIACVVLKYREIGQGKSKKTAKRLAANKMWVKLQETLFDQSQINQVLGQDGNVENIDDTKVYESKIVYTSTKKIRIQTTVLTENVAIKKNELSDEVSVCESSSSRNFDRISPIIKSEKYRNNRHGSHNKSDWFPFDIGRRYSSRYDQHERLRSRDRFRFDRRDSSERPDKSDRYNYEQSHIQVKKESRDNSSSCSLFGCDLDNEDGLELENLLDLRAKLLTQIAENEKRNEHRATSSDLPTSELSKDSSKFSFTQTSKSTQKNLATSAKPLGFTCTKLLTQPIKEKNEVTSSTSEDVTTAQNISDPWIMDVVKQAFVTTEGKSSAAKIAANTRERNPWTDYERLFNKYNRKGRADHHSSEKVTEIHKQLEVQHFNNFVCAADPRLSSVRHVKVQPQQDSTGMQEFSQPPTVPPSQESYNMNSLAAHRGQQHTFPSTSQYQIQLRPNLIIEEPSNYKNQLLAVNSTDISPQDQGPPVHSECRPSLNIKRQTYEQSCSVNSRLSFDTENKKAPMTYGEYKRSQQTAVSSTSGKFNKNKDSEVSDEYKRSLQSVVSSSSKLKNNASKVSSEHKRNHHAVVSSTSKKFIKNKTQITSGEFKRSRKTTDSSTPEKFDKENISSASSTDISTSHLDNIYRSYNFSMKPKVTGSKSDSKFKIPKKKPNGAAKSNDNYSNEQPKFREVTDSDNSEIEVIGNGLINCDIEGSESGGSEEVESNGDDVNMSPGVTKSRLTKECTVVLKKLHPGATVKSLTSISSRKKDEGGNRRINEIDEAQNIETGKTKRLSSHTVVVKNNNPERHCLKKGMECKLCDKSVGISLVSHYVNIHPDQEVFRCPIAPDVADLLRNSTEVHRVYRFPRKKHKIESNEVEQMDTSDLDIKPHIDSFLETKSRKRSKRATKMDNDDTELNGNSPEKVRKRNESTERVKTESLDPLICDEGIPIVIKTETDDDYLMEQNFAQETSKEKTSLWTIENNCTGSVTLQSLESVIVKEEENYGPMEWEIPAITVSPNEDWEPVIADPTNDDVEMDNYCPTNEEHSNIIDDDDCGEKSGETTHFIKCKILPGDNLSTRARNRSILSD